MSGAVANEVNETVLEGTTVTLTAEFDPAVGPFYYQWSKDGVTLPDEREPMLRFAPVRLSDAGSYIVYVTNAGGTASSEPAILRVAALNPSRLSHFSLIATSNPLTVGFGLMDGNKAATTPLLIRAAGPALAQFGVETFMPDPKLRVFRTDAAIAENDNWVESSTLTTARREAGAFAFSAGSLDAALLLTLGPNSYTTQIDEAAGGRGSALFEWYDLSSGATRDNPRLVSLSARVMVRPADQTVIAGFTIRGESSLRILARAIGPGLAQFGVSSPLANPTLSLHRDGTVIATNENWREGNVVLLAAAARQVGAFALAPEANDGALIALLAPGAYTLQLGAGSSAGGTALIELYEVP